MDTSYNPVSISYTNEIFEDIVLEDMSQEKALVNQDHTYFSVLLSEYDEPQNFQQAWNQKYPE